MSFCELLDKCRKLLLTWVGDIVNTSWSDLHVLSVCQSVCVCVSVCLSLCLSVSLCLSMCQYVWHCVCSMIWSTRSVCQSVCLYVCLSVWVSVCLCLSVSLSVSMSDIVHVAWSDLHVLSVNLSVCLSVCVSVSLYVCFCLSLCVSLCVSMSDIVYMQHDLIYTFFHPMLRDEQDFDKTNVLKLRGRFFSITVSLVLMSPRCWQMATFVPRPTNQCLFNYYQLWHNARHNGIIIETKINYSYSLMPKCIARFSLQQRGFLVEFWGQFGSVLGWIFRKPISDIFIRFRTPLVSGYKGHHLSINLLYFSEN